MTDEVKGCLFGEADCGPAVYEVTSTFVGGQPPTVDTMCATCAARYAALALPDNGPGFAGAAEVIETLTFRLVAADLIRMLVLSPERHAEMRATALDVLVAKVGIAAEEIRLFESSGGDELNYSLGWSLGDGPQRGNVWCLRGEWDACDWENPDRSEEDGQP